MLGDLCPPLYCTFEVVFTDKYITAQYLVKEQTATSNPTLSGMQQYDYITAEASLF
jgi:hypothetical protein